jgi:hypothetical protein
MRESFKIETVRVQSVQESLGMVIVTLEVPESPGRMYGDS